MYVHSYSPPSADDESINLNGNGRGTCGSVKVQSSSSVDRSSRKCDDFDRRLFCFIYRVPFQFVHKDSMQTWLASFSSTNRFIFVFFQVNFAEGLYISGGLTLFSIASKPTQLCNKVNSFQQFNAWIAKG